MLQLRALNAVLGEQSSWEVRTFHTVKVRVETLGATAPHGVSSLLASWRVSGPAPPRSNAECVVCLCGVIWSTAERQAERGAQSAKNTTRDEEGGSEVWPCSRELGTGTTMHKNSTISHL